MGKSRAIWRVAPVTTSVAIGVFLAACSHSPVTPAPVYMGAARVMDTRSPATPWLEPAAISPSAPAARAAETHRAMAPPAPAGRTAQTEHASHRPIAAGNHPARAHKKARPRLATRHVAAAARKQATIYPVPERTTTPGAGGETIPLDGPAAASTAWPPAVPPASATSPERTNSSWVSPSAAEPASREPQRVVR